MKRDKEIKNSKEFLALREEFNKTVDTFEHKFAIEREPKVIKIDQEQIQSQGLDIQQLLKSIWSEVFDPDVIYLSNYKFERSQRYPGVGYKFFSDFFDHKKWLEKERQRVMREHNNQRIINMYKKKEKKDV